MQKRTSYDFIKKAS